VFTATWVAPGQVYHDVQKLVGADTERGAAIPPSTAWLGHASSETRSVAARCGCRTSVACDWF